MKGSKVGARLPSTTDFYICRSKERSCGGSAKWAYRTSVVPRSRFKGMSQATFLRSSFSGLADGGTRRFANHVAYAALRGVEQSDAKALPSDISNPISLRQLCANDEEAPLNVPLHPGARRFYRGTGLLWHMSRGKSQLGVAATLGRPAAGKACSGKKTRSVPNAVPAKRFRSFIRLSVRLRRID
jgi:hypothetical protein